MHHSPDGGLGAWVVREVLAELHVDLIDKVRDVQALLEDVLRECGRERHRLVTTVAEDILVQAWRGVCV